MAAEPIRREDQVVAEFTARHKPPKRTNGVDEGANHYALACAFVEADVGRTGHRTVYALGSLWCVSDAVWMPHTLESIAVKVGSLYGGHKFCNRGSDFNANFIGHAGTPCIRP